MIFKAACPEYSSPLCLCRYVCNDVCATLVGCTCSLGMPRIKAYVHPSGLSLDVAIQIHDLLYYTLSNLIFILVHYFLAHSAIPSYLQT